MPSSWTLRSSWTASFKKNRYAGRKVWDDKKEFTVADIDIDKHPTQRIKVSGMEMKQTNTAKVGRNVQIDTLKALFDGVGERVIQRNIKRLVRSIVGGEFPVKQLSGLVKVGKHLPHHLDWRGLPIECSCGDCPKPKTGDEGKDDDACYVDNYWSSTISLWYNEHLCVNDTATRSVGSSSRTAQRPFRATALSHSASQKKSRNTPSTTRPSRSATSKTSCERRMTPWAGTFAPSTQTSGTTVSIPISILLTNRERLPDGDGFDRPSQHVGVADGCARDEASPRVFATHRRQVDLL